MLLAACEAAREPEPALVTQIEALTPLPPRTARPEPAGELQPTGLEPLASAAASGSACADVQRQALELGASLPRQLDADTRATRVAATGCDLRLEYELVTLSAREVSQDGLRAMRGQVMDRLCSDKGALAVMQRGGRFTNVYYDRVQAPIALFTVAADDCGI